MSRRDRARAGSAQLVQTNWIDAKRVSSHCPGPASYSTRGALQIPLSSHTHERIQSIRNHSPNWKSREAVRALHTAARRLQASWNPNSSNVKANDHLPERLTDEQRAYKHLRPVIDSLPGPIDWAVAYGSGVRHQANSDPSGVNPTTTFLPSRIAEQQKPPMTDFLLSTPSLPEFHSANLRRNPSHYPLTARLLGGRRIAWLTERWGAGLWYVTMVNIRGLVSVFISELSGGGLGLIREEVKYGVISTEKLKKDLQGWDTLYVAGRLHKPVLPLLTPPSLSEASQTNLHSALSLSLLLLPPRFPESALWEQIAGTSYAGDPRMSVPGAENPEKVKNIVRGEGAREGMRGMYGGMMESLGVGIVNGEKRTDKGRISWGGDEEVMLEQPDTPEYRYRLFMALPVSLRKRIMAKYGSSAPTTLSDREEAERLWTEIISGKAILAGGPSQDWRKVIMDEVSNIIRRPALTQSFKGLFTAGFRKSFVYAMAKFGKWLKGRQGKNKA